jgi:hypothetical protein
MKNRTRRNQNENGPQARRPRISQHEQRDTRRDKQERQVSFQNQMDEVMRRTIHVRQSMEWAKVSKRS